MKRTSFTFDLGKYRKMGQGAGSLVRMFIALSAGTLAFFILMGFIGYAQARLDPSPVSAMKGLAAAVSNDFFVDMLGLEVPHLTEQKSASTFSQKNVFGFVFRLLTDINPRDPKTLISREVPGLGNDSPVLLRKTKSTDPAAGPLDYSPAKDGAGVADSQPANQASQTGSAADSLSPSPAPSPAAEPAKALSAASGKKAVLIYHSHNRESWVPELGLDPKKADSAFSEKINVTLVGKRMAEKLEGLGIGAVNYATDYQVTEQNFNYYYSYKYSAKTVKEAFAAHPEIQFVFDIHRDSSAREKTTITIGGKDYAQLYFIVGQKNPGWQKNERFASQIQERLEKKLPGVSRGIWGKSPHDGNAEYNQSVSPNSILIEIGGVFNTLEETYRTADVLAEVIADMYWDAAKVNAPAGGSDDALQNG